jgi:hypothetical protein
VKDKVALQRGFLRALGFPLSGIPPVFCADPLAVGASVQQAAVRRHDVSLTVACKTRIVSWKSLARD